MIASFMAYGTAIAALLAVAALAVERAFGVFALPRRGVWLVTIVASVGIPLLMMLSPPAPSVMQAPIQLSTDSKPIPDVATTPQRATSSAAERQRSPIQWPSLPGADSLLAALWLAMSTLLACAYSIGWWRVKRTAVQGESIEIEGHQVIVTDDIGPAVFGFARPRVVIPRWVLQSSRAVRDLVLQHEFQHVTARDQWSLLLALIAVVIAPWNLALWWQLRRLRLAIEIDCDARVLARGADPAAYGEVLLSVGRLHLAAPSATVALTEPRSDLERRIRAFASAPPRHRNSVALGCGALCVSMLAAAAQIDAPAAPTTLRLPPPQSSTMNEIEAAVRREFPELFGRSLAQPVLVEVLFNNDMTLDVAQKRSLAPGTTFEAAVGDDEHGSSFSAARLHPDDPRRTGRIAIKDTPASAPVYIAFTAREVAKSRSAAVVESALQAQFPELYDDESDFDTLLVALMNDDGTVNKALHRPRRTTSIAGEQSQLEALAELGIATAVGSVSFMNGSKTPPYKPFVLYAFPQSNDPVVEALPYATDTWQRVGMQRAMVRRYFPDTASGAENGHKLLWILLDADGRVVQSGRTIYGPESFVGDLEAGHPGARNAKRLVTPLSSLFGKPMRDTKGQPILAAFIWLPAVAPQANAPPELALEAKVYRNDKGVAWQRRAARFDENLSSLYVQDDLRFDMTAVKVSDEEVEVRVQVQARIDRKDVEFADPWETVGNPTVRIRYGREAVIEQGVRYPNSDKSPEVLRIVVTPHRS